MSMLCSHYVRINVLDSPGQECRVVRPECIIILHEAGQSRAEVHSGMASGRMMVTA